MNKLHNNSGKSIIHPVSSSVIRCCLLFVLFLAAFTGLRAQDKIAIKGTVRNEAGETLSGATILVQGTKIFATSKKDGTFEITDIPEGSTLRISYVGYTNRSIKLVTGQKIVSIALVPAANVMGDVTVNTGLYKRPVGNFTGAAKSYSGEELKTVNPVNVLAALAVVEPSVRLFENNALGSDPNQLPIIQLRGQNNLVLNSASTANATATPVSNGDFMSSYLLNPNQPLIILDGFQTSLQVIYEMDINRIARITVLKDAAATAAYGSKAANGVIVVETKQPAVGKVQVTYNINANFQVPDLSSYNLMDAKEMLEAQRLAGVYSDPNNNFNDVGLKQWYDRRLYQAESGVNTDWMSRPIQTGVGLNHSLNISGGTGAVRYSLSLSYLNSEGVMKGSNRSAYGINNNLSYVSKNIRFTNTTGVNYSRGNNTRWGGFGNYSKQFPFFSPYDSAGNLTLRLEPLNSDVGIPIPAPGGTTPVFINPEYNTQVNVEDYTYALTFTNNSSFDWSITSNLRMNASFAFANSTPGAEQFLPAEHSSFSTSTAPNFADFGSYSQTRGKNTVLDGRLSLNHYKKIGRHTILTALGFSAQQTTSTTTSVKVTGIPNEHLNELGLAAGYGANLKPASSNNNTRSISEFLSVSYNYDERYTLEVTANASGSSQFGSNNRIAPFWAGGLGWNVDKEKFFSKNNVIQQMRIRGTIGLTGNQNFSAYLAQPIYEYNLLNNYRLQLGGNLQGYANPDLKWQQTMKTNIGVTMGLFNGRLNIGGDYYLENTDNLILPLDVAPSTGFPSYQDNLGATRNTGFEISINVPVIRDRKRNIFWTVGFNTGHYKNVITKLSPAIDVLNKANNSGGLQGQTAPKPRFVVGESMTRIWAVPSLGIDPATGREIFVKLDGSQTFTWDPNDKVPVGDANSKFKGAFSSSLTYKNFSLNMNFAYQYGGQIYNQTLVDKIENVDLKGTNADRRVLTERWKAPGDNASFKSLVQLGGFQTTPVTSRFVQDDNYINASSISISYTLPRWEWVRRLGLTLPRLAITQNDVFRFATSKLERGIGYPFARSFNIGLSTTF